MALQSTNGTNSTCTVSPTLKNNYCYREKQLRIMNPCGHGNITQICSIQPFKKHNETDCYDRFISLCRVHAMHQQKNRANSCILPNTRMLEWCICEDFSNGNRNENQWYECECFHNYNYVPYNKAKKYEKATKCNCDCEEIYRKKCQLYDKHGNFKYHSISCEIQKEPLTTDFKFNCSNNPITVKHPNRTIVPCEIEGVNISTIPTTINLGLGSQPSNTNHHMTTLGYQGTSSKNGNYPNASLISSDNLYTHLNTTNFRLDKTVGYGSLALVIFGTLGIIYMIMKKLRKQPYAPVLTFDEDEDDYAKETSKVSFVAKKFKKWKYNALPHSENEAASLLSSDERELIDSDDDLIVDI